MLKPEDRELLVDAIRPDPGYELDHALITTYTLSLDALLAIPLALTFHAWSGDTEQGDGDGKKTLDPVALLEALRRYAGKLTVLGQAGAIAQPRNASFLTFLEPVVHGVSAPRDGIFHPKFWLLRFAPTEEGPIRYRLLCLSRNLTFDRSWDTMLKLDATLAEHRTLGYSSNAPLRAFVTDLLRVAGEAPGGIDPQRREKIETMAEEVARLEFKFPEGVEEHRFWPLGFDSTSWSKVFEGRRDRTFVISPFVTEDFLSRLDLGPDDILVSRADELAMFSEEAREKIGRISVIGDVASIEPEPDDEAEDGQPDDTTLEDNLSGLHAKVFVADAGWNARVWTGSANATGAAFWSNVEFMIELRGRKSMLGIDKILDPGGDEGLDKLLVPYAHDPDLAPDPEERRLELEIDRLSRALGASELMLRAEAQDDAWMLELTGTESLPPVSDELEVTVWPATLQDHRALPLRQDRELPAWTRLDVPHLTSFLCVEVAAPAVSMIKRFAIAIQLEGAPGDRQGAVIRSILANRDHVLRYLLMLLGDHDVSSLDVFSARQDSGAGGFGEFLGLGAEPTLFEALVRTLHRDPDRIDQVERLLRELGATEAADLLPEGFDEIFEPVREARQRLGS